MYICRKEQKKKKKAQQYGPDDLFNWSIRVHPGLTRIHLGLYYVVWDVHRVYAGPVCRGRRKCNLKTSVELKKLLKSYLQQFPKNLTCIPIKIYYNKITTLPLWVPFLVGSGSI